MNIRETLQNIYEIATSAATEGQKIQDISRILMGIPSFQLHELHKDAEEFSEGEGLCNAIKSHSRCHKVIEFLRDHKLCSGEILTQEDAERILMDAFEKAFSPTIDLSKEYSQQPKPIVSENAARKATEIYSDVMQFSDDNPTRIKDHLGELDSVRLAELKVAFAEYKPWVCTKAHNEHKPDTMHLLAEHGLCPATYIAGTLLGAKAIDENATTY